MKLLQASLQLTLQNAARHPYYIELWGSNVCHDVTRLGFLECLDLLNYLPPTPKEALRSELYPQPMPDDYIVAIGHTSGTTGIPINWCRTASESRAALSIRMKEAETNLGMRRPTKAIGIRAYPPFHGVPNPPFDPSLDHTYFIDCAVFEESAFERFKALLLQQFHMPGFEDRVSVLATSPQIFVPLTEGLIAAGISAEDLKVRRLEMFGGYLNAVFASFLTDYWKDTLFVNTYSMSEVQRGGVVCGKCGYIHFPPHIHPQVVNLNDNAMIFQGEGLLAVTVLLPFGTAQPLIKYLNGDIMEIIDERMACCSAHVGGLRARGRVATSTFLLDRGKKELLVASHDMHDVFFHPAVHKMRVGLANFGIDSLLGLSGNPCVASSRAVDVGSNLQIKYQASRVFGQSAPDFRQRLIKQSRNLRRALDRRRVGVDVSVVEQVSEVLLKS